MKFIRAFLLAFILIICLGCTSIRTRDAYKEMLLANVQNSNFEGAIQLVEEAKAKSFSQKDMVLYYLYQGVLLHYNNQYIESNIAFDLAEKGIEDLYTKSVTRAAASLFLNDNVFAYAGEDYEDIYINIFKALNYINLDRPESAFVEIRKVNIKLNLLEDKYKKFANQMNQSEETKIELKVVSTQFNNSALARYLSMLLYRAANKQDDTKVDMRYIDEVFKLQANIYNFAKPDLTNFLTKETGKTKLSFLSFTGLAPQKYPKNYRVVTSENAIHVFVDDGTDAHGQMFFFPGISAGYFFKFSVPQMREKQSNITRIKIEVNGQELGQLQKIEDINRIAKETFQTKANMAYVRAITRTVTKGIASIATQKKIEESTGELGGMFAKFGTAALTEASEAADLRSCIILPGFAYIGDFDLAPGTHNIRVKYMNRYGVEVFAARFDNYEVKFGEVNLIESHYLN